MANVMGVRFLQSCRPYYFEAGEIEAERGDKVIVSTSKGVDIGVVMFPPTEIPEDKITQPLQPVLRLATADDLAKVDANREKEKEAFAIAKEKIEIHNPEMKLVGVEYAFDDSKILFYFIADGRVDFRALVRDLAGVFRTRIELRQIGVRDEARMKGGIGVCGRELCCASYMSDFAPVSIKMAKDQNLSLNPSKISGNCGRLMCCLKNEEETYEYLNAQMPRVGRPVTLPNGETGSVASVNILRQTVRILFINEKEEKEIREYTLDEVLGRAPMRTEQKLPPEKTPGPEETETWPEEGGQTPETPAAGGRRGRDRRKQRGAERGTAAKDERTGRAPARPQPAPAPEPAPEPAPAPETGEAAEPKKGGRSRRRRRGDKPQGAAGKPEAAEKPAAEKPAPERPAAEKPAEKAAEPAGGGKAPEGGRSGRRRRHRPKRPDGAGRAGSDE